MANQLIDTEPKTSENKMVQFETVPAIKLGFSAISLQEVDIINKYIDDNIDRLPDLSYQLVGQIKQDKRSAQPEFILTDEVPQQLGKFFIECAQTYAAEHPLTNDMKRTLGEKEEYFVKKMWSVHSYEGDYNPLHEHGTVSGRGVSMIMYLKLPPQVAILAEGMNEGTLPPQHSTSGSTDGLTQFVWGSSSMYDAPRFKHAPFAHVAPEVGKIVIFPIWLLHQVSPFWGPGERRTMSCNIDIINSPSDSQLEEVSKQEPVHIIRGERSNV